MTEIRIIKPTTSRLPSLITLFAYLVTGSAFLAASAVHTSLHDQRLPPLLDMMATVTVGIALVSHSILSLKKALGR